MKPTLLIFLLLITLNGYSQGLNCELGFNDDYDQSAKSVACVDNYTYLVKFQRTSSFESYSTLYKIDTAGIIIFNSPITPITAEFTEVHEMILSEDGGVYILGFGLPVCDWGQNCFWFIQKFDSTGNVSWTHSWVNATCNNEYLTGLSLNENNELLVNFTDDTSISHVYTIDNNGLFTDSLQINHSQLSGFCELTGYEFIAYKSDSLCAFDTNGNSINNIVFNTAIQNIITLNDSLYVLTRDSVFIFDNNLNALQSSDVTGYSFYSNLKVTNNIIQLISSGTGYQTILDLDKQLQLQNAFSIPVAINFVAKKDFSNSHFSVAIEFPITLHEVIRYLDYSLSSTQNVSVNNSDIGVVDVDISQTYIQPYAVPGVYYYQIFALALVKNYGNNVVTSCRLNHRVTQFQTCNEFFYTNEFTNLNLLPNDSIWINLGMVDHNTNNFVDTIDVDLCVFTSHPNLVTDTIVSNDQFCRNVFLGMVGLSENMMQNISVSPNPVKDVVNVENPDLLKLTVYFYDNSGKVTSSTSGSGRMLSFDLSNKSKGLYLVRIISDKGEVTKKIMKQ